MKKIVFILTVVYFLFSCNKEHKNHRVIDLDRMASVSVNEFIDSVFVVQLESAGDSFFGVASQVIQYKNRLYIRDSRTQSILCFEIGGKFLFTICEYGAGPGQYIYLSDFTVGEYNKQYVFTHTLEGITFYGAQYSGDYMIIPSNKRVIFEERDLTFYNFDLLSENDRNVIERHDPENENP